QKRQSEVASILQQEQLKLMAKDQTEGKVVMAITQSGFNLPDEENNLPGCSYGNRESPSLLQQLRGENYFVDNSNDGEEEDDGDYNFILEDALDTQDVNMNCVFQQNGNPTHPDPDNESVSSDITYD
ncbi:unnamed protein product, partial [Allacma fusca]